MRILICIQIFLFLTWAGCKTKEKDSIILPDLRSHFAGLLNRRDSTLSLDSFYFIRMDTMSEKKAYTHQRFTFLHIMEKIDNQLERMNTGMDTLHGIPSANKLDSIENLNEEKKYVRKEIDSFNILIAKADSTAPIGFRAFYKVTVSRKNQFTVSDTVPYSITLKMNVSDWDRNIEKSIDSLAIGKSIHSGGIH